MPGGVFVTVKPGISLLASILDRICKTLFQWRLLPARYRAYLNYNFQVHRPVFFGLSSCYERLNPRFEAFLRHRRVTYRISNPIIRSGPNIVFWNKADYEVYQQAAALQHDPNAIFLGDTDFGDRLVQLGIPCIAGPIISGVAKGWRYYYSLTNSAAVEIRLRFDCYHEGSYCRVFPDDDNR